MEAQAACYANTLRPTTVRAAAGSLSFTRPSAHPHRGETLLALTAIGLGMVLGTGRASPELEELVDAQCQLVSVRLASTDAADRR